MSFRDQTYLVILNWLCSIDLVSHLCVALCVSKSSNFRPLREKKKSIWFPSVYFPQQNCCSEHLMGQYLWLSIGSLFSSSPFPPASSYLLPFHFSVKMQAKWMLEAPAKHWVKGSRGGVGEGHKLPCVVLVRCCVVSSQWSHLLWHYDLPLENHLCSLSLPINEVTAVKSCCHSDEESPVPIDLTSGGERWPQAHQQVEIICGRSSWQEMHCNMTMEVKAQIKRKWSNACEEGEDSGG